MLRRHFLRASLLTFPVWGTLGRALLGKTSPGGATERHAPQPAANPASSDLSPADFLPGATPSLNEWLRAPRFPVHDWPHAPPDTLFDLPPSFFFSAETHLARHLLDAIACQQTISFAYRDPDTEPRRVTPALFFTVGNYDPPYYLTGYCHLRQATRTFRFDRIFLDHPLFRMRFASNAL